MRSYSITLNPDNVKGRYIAFTVSGRALLYTISGALLLIIGVFTLVFSGLILPFDRVMHFSNRVQHIRIEIRDQNEIQNNFQESIEHLQNRVDYHLAVTEKLNFLYGIEDMGAGGYATEAGTALADLLDSMNLIERKYERLSAFTKTLDYLPIRFPLDSPFRLSSGFGLRRSPFTSELEMHKGIDFAAQRGTIIKAAGAGKVHFAGQWTDIGDPKFSRLGFFVWIIHGNINYQSYYGHCQKVLVRSGDFVKAGEPIALVGNTGLSTGPHLHFSIKKDGRFVDPKSYLINFDLELVQNQFTNDEVTWRENVNGR